MESYDKLSKKGSKKYGSVNGDDQMEAWETALRKRWMSVDLEMVKEYQDIKKTNIKSLSFKKNLNKLQKVTKNVEQIQEPKSPYLRGSIKSINNQKRSSIKDVKNEEINP